MGHRTIQQHLAWYRASYHEAGHAVVLDDGGVRVLKVWVKWKGWFNPKVEGLTTDEDEDGDGRGAYIDVVRATTHAYADMAGWAAAYRAGRELGFTEEKAQAWASAGMEPDEARLKARIKTAKKKFGGKWKVARQDAIDGAVTIVNERWKRVEKAAERLDRTGKLSGDQIR